MAFPSDRTGGAGPPDESADVVDGEVVDDADLGDVDRSTDDLIVDATGEDADIADAEVVDDADAEVVDDATVAQERDEYLDALRRMQADFENYRKRSMKQQADSVDYATGRIVEDLLPVLDACEAGVEHGDDGVTAVFAALLGALEKSGLARVDPLGEPFDPNSHEAVLHEPSDDEIDGPVIAEVMRPGYIWKGRVLRAAMVKVRG